MKNNKKKLIKIIIISVVALLLINGWLIWENKSLTVTEYTVTSDKLPEGFSGFRIAQVSDLHNTEFGADNKRLISHLEEIAPDIIVITGDLIDSRRIDIDVAVSFAEQASKIAPVYYVNGNHEKVISDEEYSVFTSRLANAGITVLENEKVYLEKNGERIAILGVQDPVFGEYTEETDFGKTVVDENVRRLNDINEYSILLSHRPELFDIYVKNKIDVALTGHSHGGQIRLPFVGGVFVPNQGLFPTYDSGMFAEDGTTMILSRGLGNSRPIIPRINNRPEIVVIELVAEK